MEYLNFFNNNNINIDKIIKNIINSINESSDFFFKEENIEVILKQKKEKLKISDDILELIEKDCNEIKKELILTALQKTFYKGPCIIDTIHGKYQFRLEEQGITISCIKKEKKQNFIEDFIITTNNKSKIEIESEVKTKVQLLTKIYPSEHFKNQLAFQNADEHYNNCIFQSTMSGKNIYNKKDLENLFTLFKNYAFNEISFDKTIELLKKDYLKDLDTEIKIKTSLNQLYDILKDNNHNKENIFYFNDYDYKVFYTENEKYKIIENKSSAVSYLTMIDKKTNHIKIWDYANTDIEKYWSFLQERKNMILGTEILQAISNHYEHTTYPFEMLGNSYKKSENFLINNFEEKNFILYDSNLGFKNNELFNTNNMLSDIYSSQKSICDKYEIDITQIKALNIDVDTPEYFIRKMLHSKNKKFNNRTEVLFYALCINGNNHEWNKNGGLNHEDTLLKNYEVHPNEMKKEKLNLVIPISKNSNFFKINDQRKEWKEVAFEVLEAIDIFLKNEENKNSVFYDDIKKSYSKCKKYLNNKNKNNLTNK